RGVYDPESTAMPGEHRIDRIARRARHVAHEHALFAQQAVDDRRLADVRPADDGHCDLVGFWIWDWGFGSILRFGRGALVNPYTRIPANPESQIPHPDRFPNPTQQIRHAGAVLRGDLDHGVESELIEIERRVARALVVGFVDRDEHGPSCLPQLARDRLVAR